MSNAKMVRAKGEMPFNTWDDTEIIKLLGHLNQPNGLHLYWNPQPIEKRPNEYGGVTTIYEFTIEGIEGYSVEFFEWIVTTVRNFLDSSTTFSGGIWRIIPNGMTC